MLSDASKSHEYDSMPLSSVDALPLKVTAEPVVAVLSAPAFATGGLSTESEAVVIVSFGFSASLGDSEL
ncbi:MAG: hypothetical protein A4E23_00565 [Methanomethylovorans sp. PtaU1.Bin073]|nr:MAG: hypothetical protein A4E23_00565 [Methanomethylovorans sp. PtaU1.Bin073]